MMYSKTHLLHPLPEDLTEEAFTALLRHDAVRIDRIVFNGHTTPEGFGYDQDEHEGVLRLAGEAEIAFTRDEPVPLTRGDTLHLPAHTGHRVTFTSRPAVGLAVFY